ncbi:schwannomin-interacting protein 1-like [Oppia nitens]|uniref:schwannomin-interacting protein 1-like n=1 Tax=Oppia nitens TaxID=1686743 RepID=UPI0023DB600A|nr:schwannomin-interacting protein 1-like [Oppia nitens]
MDKSNHLSFDDREEIRRRLAFDSDNEDMIYGMRSSRKSTLMNRLQNCQSLQICFMNETVSETNNQKDNGSVVDNRPQSRQLLDNSHITKPNESPNNNSSLNISDSLHSLNISKHQTTVKRPNHLFNKLDSESFDIDNYDLFSYIEKPIQKSMFADYHSKLHNEARLALAQVKKIVKKQIEREREKRNISRKAIYKLINVDISDDNQMSKSFLDNLNVSQLQIIVNDMLSQIECLNSELVQLLMRRDELYMSQDSVLVDIQDLTIFSCSKQ